MVSPKDVSIVKRVSTGISLLVVVGLAIVIVSMFTLNYAAARFDVYEQTRRETRVVQTMESTIASLQRQILSYRISGNAAAIDDIRRSIGELNDNVTVIGTLDWLVPVDGHNIAEEIQASVDVIAQNIDSLQAQRQNWSGLETNLLQSFERAFEQVSALNENNASRDIGNQLMLIQLDLARAQSRVIRYFSDKEFHLSQSASEYLSEAKEKVGKVLQKNHLDSQSVNNFKGVVKTIDEIKRDFFKAIQSDRSFIVLVNVVIAGQTVELHSLAARVHALSGAHQSAILAENHRTLERAQFFALTGSVLIGVIAVLVSLWIVRALVGPLKEITRTFNQLSRGEVVNVIPHVDSFDEIGQLARAANQFKLTSDRTHQLLEQSEALTQNLAAREAELERSIEDLDNFAYVASHDLKSPLRAIQNLSEWIEEDCGHLLPDESKEHFRLLKSRIGRMENLLTDLLRYSRVGRLESEVDSVAVRDLIEGVIELINVPDNFTFRIPDDLPTLITHVTPLQQVFQNLFSNAVKYNDKTIAWVSVSAQDLGNNLVEFRVTDNGMGIPPEYRERVFQMFHTLHSRDDIESSGMGLAIVKKAVENEGGSIHIESPGSEGTCFVFTWPKYLKLKPTRG